MGDNYIYVNKLYLEDKIQLVTSIVMFKISWGDSAPKSKILVVQWLCAML